VTKNTENPEKKTFPRTFPLIKSASPARIASISSASENSNDGSFYDLRYLLKRALATKIINHTSYRRNSNKNTKNTEKKTFSIGYFA